MIVVVADTSPLNYLIQIHCDHVFPALYERVFVPSAVVEELNHPGTIAAVRTWLTRVPSWLVVEQVAEAADAHLARLDPGECQAMSDTSDRERRIFKAFPRIEPEFWPRGDRSPWSDGAVDIETGRIEVTKLVNVADVGRAIDPASVARQLTGAAIMQLGFTLFEKMVFSDGQVVNASLADYKIPGFLDVPQDLSAAYVEVPHTHGPYGAKGVGETGVFSPSPAIANALYDAVGVAVKDLPLTPERVLRAIREAEGRPLGNR